MVQRQPCRMQVSINRTAGMCGGSLRPSGALRLVWPSPAPRTGGRGQASTDTCCPSQRQLGRTPRVPPVLATAADASLGDWKRIDDFLDWFKCNGGKLHSCLGIQRTSSGFGVTVESLPDDQSRASSDHEALISVPSKLCINAATAEAHPVSALWSWAWPDQPSNAGGGSGRWRPADADEVLQQSQRLGIDPMGPLRAEQIRVALFLLAESRDPSSWWQPYLLMLPTVEELQRNALFWDDESLYGYYDVALAECALRDQANAQAIYKHFVTPGFPSCCGSLPTLDELKWALAVAESRALFGSFGSGVSYCALLPMIDLVNHGAIPLEEPVAASDDSCVALEGTEVRLQEANCMAVDRGRGVTSLVPIAKGSLRPGVELLHSYNKYAPRWDGVLPAHVSLLSYGFLGSDTPGCTIQSHTMFPKSPHGERMRKDFESEVSGALPWWRPSKNSIRECEKDCAELARDLEGCREGTLEETQLRYRLGKALAVGYEAIARVEANGGPAMDAVVEMGQEGYRSRDPGARLFWRSVLDHRRGLGARQSHQEFPPVPIGSAWASVDQTLGQGSARAAEVVDVDVVEAVVGDSAEQRKAPAEASSFTMEDVVRLLADPETAALMAQPEVQAALQRCTTGQTSMAEEPELQELTRLMGERLQ